MLRFRTAVLAAFITSAACDSVSGLTGGRDEDGGVPDGGNVADTSTNDDANVATDAGDAAVDGAFVSKYRAAVLADSPLLYWRLGETGGSSAANEVDGDAGAGAGTYIGAIGYAVPGAISGDPDPAIDFKGAGRVFVNDPRLAFSGKASFTLEAWVKPHSHTTVYRRLFSRERSDTAPYGGYAMHSQSGSTSFNRFVDSGGSDFAEKSSALPLEVWSHVVGTFDGTEMRLYIDGAVEAIENLGIRDLAPADMPFTVAADSRYGNSRMDAVIDEVAVYDHALTAARVTAHYQAGIAK